MVKERMHLLVRENYEVTAEAQRTQRELFSIQLFFSKSNLCAFAPLRLDYFIC